MPNIERRSRFISARAFALVAGRERSAAKKDSMKRTGYSRFLRSVTFAGFSFASGLAIKLAVAEVLCIIPAATFLSILVSSRPDELILKFEQTLLRTAIAVYETSKPTVLKSSNRARRLGDCESEQHAAHRRKVRCHPGQPTWYSRNRNPIQPSSGNAAFN